MRRVWRGRAGPGAMERFGGGGAGGFDGAAGYDGAAEQLSRQQERHYRLLSELQALVKALPR